MSDAVVALVPMELPSGRLIGPSGRPSNRNVFRNASAERECRHPIGRAAVLRVTRRESRAAIGFLSNLTHPRAPSRLVARSRHSTLRRAPIGPASAGRVPPTGLGLQGSRRANVVMSGG